MLEEFIEQNYLIIESNVVTNVCIWNGDTSTWTPPAGSIALIQANTPTMVWTLDASLQPPDYVLTEQLGNAQIGFTWDGTTCTTNEPKPIYVPPIPKENQPKTTGTTTI